ncbi:hypothetical protein LEP1GSC126_2424 [Leptospira kirschneri str. 200801774]|nr:hypothetical protein LEP1GSC126_2424 [Leptospira kirschneri str. 200801774]
MFLFRSCRMKTEAIENATSFNKQNTKTAMSARHRVCS